ncbi:MAG: porphobilinogen synthase [Candidatus Omnitrophica bacterium]|nr:porphobilinogen synthase [Candidatus Omnitrophota bacterium]
MYYPITRLSRLRKTQALREMFRETDLDVRSLVNPVFVVEGKDVKEQVESMPGIFRLSLDMLLKEIKEIENLRIPGVLLFGSAEKKDERGTSAYSKNGIVQTAVKAIKDKYPELVVISDVCLCAYTTSGHCGIVKSKAVPVGLETEKADSKEENIISKDVVIYNDATCELLAKMAVSHAEAGVDMVAPSSMMDGQVSVLRRVLDTNNFKHIPIMAYSAKFASGFYAPFREAAQSAPEFGDRKTYQLNAANSREALKEIELDIQEGADIVMVKPALAYLDIIAKAKQAFNVPIAAYNVSGEYSMVKAAASAELIDEKLIVLEMMTGFKRAGADIIITYHAKDVARWLSGQFLL